MTEDSYKTDMAFAQAMDRRDPLARYRSRFHMPRAKDGQDCVYLCGNSLGLQPVAVKAAMEQELDDWARYGVEGHWQAQHPWMSYHETAMKGGEHVAGAVPGEVVTMNSLTVNLHLMMVSFYRPSPGRYKILIEKNAFPSDIYAVRSQILYHGFNPETAMIEVTPRTGEQTIDHSDILDAIEKEGDSIALILIGGVNYYTGQLFDMKGITEAGHKKGCFVGFDLAHAAGNVCLNLHDWNVDFACWCSYKYLNGGPGALAGCFVHERHGHDHDGPRFAGWWGNDKAARFRMGRDFNPISGAEGWQLSNPPIFSFVPVRVSLDMFLEAGMDALINKSKRLTGYLDFMLDNLGGDAFDVITPKSQGQRGCQMSIVVKKNGRTVFDALQEEGVICDWREPDCIRVAPVPFYNSFMDVFRFCDILSRQLGGRLPDEERIAQ